MVLYTKTEVCWRLFLNNLNLVLYLAIKPKRPNPNIANVDNSGTSAKETLSEPASEAVNR